MLQDALYLSRIVPVKEILNLADGNRYASLDWHCGKYIIDIRKISGSQGTDLTGLHPIQIISIHFPEPVFKQLCASCPGGTYKKDISLMPLPVLTL